MSRERSLRIPYVLLIEENDGPVFVKKGPDHTERPISWGEACPDQSGLAAQLLDEMISTFKQEVTPREAQA